MTKKELEAEVERYRQITQAHIGANVMLRREADFWKEWATEVINTCTDRKYTQEELASIAQGVMVRITP